MLISVDATDDKNFNSMVYDFNWIVRIVGQVFFLLNPFNAVDTQLKLNIINIISTAIGLPS